MNSSSNDFILYFWVTLADCFSFSFPISEHLITHQPKDTIEDYLSQLFQLIAAKESAGEQAWCEKWFVRFEQPRFWFLNVQINSQSGLGFLSAACSVCDGARLEVLNFALFPEGPRGVAAVAPWMRTVVPLSYCVYRSLYRENNIFYHDALWWEWIYFSVNKQDFFPRSKPDFFLIWSLLASEGHQTDFMWFFL